MFISVLVAIATLGGGGQTPALCSVDDCPLPALPAAVDVEPKTYDLTPYDYDVDADIFTIYTQADDFCEVMRTGLDDGLTQDELLDSAIEVMTEQGIVTTTEGAYYLRGLLVGCTL